MSLQSTSLTDLGMGPGLTANFRVRYESSLYTDVAGNINAGIQTNLINNANSLIAVLESEFIVTTGWFLTDKNKFGTSNRQDINLNMSDGSGANNSGYSSGINLDAQSGNPNAIDAGNRVKMLFMNEWVEILMSLSSGRWDASNSSGEGLSHYCGIERFPEGHQSYYSNPFVNYWLQTSDRKDWITNVENTDRDRVSYGCSLLFLYYLKSQLGYGTADIIQKGSTDLEAAYKNLTGKSGAFAVFSGLVNTFIPKGSPSLQTNDPFPLYGPTQRSLWISSNRMNIGTPTVISSGSAFQRFLGCSDGRVYHYDIVETQQQIKCTAHTWGFMFPQFNWRVNGVPVNASGNISVSAVVTVDITANSSTAIAQSINLFCILSSDHTTLSISAPSIAGHILLSVELDAFDQFAQPTVQTVAMETVHLDNEKVVWEPAWGMDLSKCLNNFISKIPRLIAPPYDHLNWAIATLLTLPDPVPFDFLQINQQIHELAIQEESANRKEIANDLRQINQFLSRRLATIPRLSVGFVNEKAAQEKDLEI
jgi:hypothetical protein